jgi:hypothetical protein
VGTPDRLTSRGGAIGKGGAAALLLMAVAALLPAAVMKGGSVAPVQPPEPAFAAFDAPCGGEPMPSPDQVITGSFGKSVEGGYVMVPFTVPAGTDAIRVKYCHDQPLLETIPETGRLNKHTLDMGVYGPRSNAQDLWDEDEFRGWGGSSRKDVTLSPEATIDPDPNPVATSETTVGYHPGPIDPGEWAVELGVAAIGLELPAEDGEVQWRVEIDLIDDPTFADEPFQPVPYDETPAQAGPGWYAGDFHVHARHSNPGDATMREVFSYAFCPDPDLDALCDEDDAKPGAGLDFITLSDYVNNRAWGEIGDFQADYPGKLIVRSAEVITYRGHINNHASLDFVDYRTGPIYERGGGGGLTPVRAARPASEILEDIRQAGGWNQLNHVETFPSEVPTFGNLCRGCSWEYSDAETNYSKVDAIEVATGPAGLQDVEVNPGPNPFTSLAIQFYEDALDAGGQNANHIAAVGSSDSHNAGRRNDPVTQSPIGQATTVVYADELSEQAIGDGVRARHTYAKIWGNDGPDLRFEAVDPSAIGEPAIMGDTIEADEATFTARVLGLDRARMARPGSYSLIVVRNGLPLLQVPIPPTGDEFELEFPSLGPARYGLEVIRPGVGAVSIEAYSSPIWHEPGDGGPPPPGQDCSITLRGTPGADQFFGTPGSDSYRGGRGRDRIKGKQGHDCLRGGRGRDLLKGGSGEDELRGNRGRDRIKAADGEADDVRCGRGRRDVAKVDPLDSVRGCERVRTPTT